MSLADGYDGIVCDLDGVVYRGSAPIPYAVAALNEAATTHGVVYATNNASRTPGTVAKQLRALGLSLGDAAVVTSSQAGARRLLELVGPAAEVLAVGGPGVAAALEEVGLRAVGTSASSGVTVAAVLQGYGADVGWRDLAEAAYAVQAGARWVATNDDATLPTERGSAPGNGMLVAAVRAATEVDAEVVGKPHTPLYELSAAVLGTSPGRTLAIGDRLDTDIAGAAAAGMDSLLVLTGVSGVADLAAAPLGARPRFVAADLRCLALPYPATHVQPVGDSVRVRCADAAMELDADGQWAGLAQADPDNQLRAGLAAIWQIRDGASQTPWPGLLPAVSRLTAAVRRERSRLDEEREDTTWPTTYCADTCSSPPGSAS